MSEKIGLVAGWGRYPMVIAEKLRAAGRQVVCVGIEGHADPMLKNICHDYREIRLLKVGKHLRYFRRNGVQQATMAGKLFKTTTIYQPFALFRFVPDWTFLKYFHPHFLTRTVDCKDDSLLLTFTRMYQEHGIVFAPATDFAPELLVKEGLLTKRRLTQSDWLDVRFGWEMAKCMGGLDIGQSVVVKDRSVLAIEAVEGTDMCIQRAGSLCAKGGFTVVKVAKPQQDMRFDVPTIGLGTLETIHKAGGKVLAIEADKTIILDEHRVVEFANRNKITILSIQAAQMGARSSAA